MEWNGDLKPFLCWPENSFSFLHNCKDDPCQGGEMKHPPVEAEMQRMGYGYGYGYGGNEGKKKRLTSKQLESLESSFQMEIKLEPERKMKLAKELGLQPRQVAVWFQNRRARWKSKQLEHLYNSLKLQFDVVNKEKQMLQQEVLALKAMMNVEGTKKPVSTCCTEISGDETVESTSVANQSPKEPPETGDHHDQIADFGHAFYFDDYGPAMLPLPCWSSVLPSHP